MQRNNTRPERMNLLADVAELYYIQGEDQAQIAKRLNLSRSMISRMLNEARKLGLVKIHIERPINQNSQLESALRKEFGLDDAIVVDNIQNSVLLPSIGKAAAQYLEKSLLVGQVLGISWGTAISAMVDEIHFDKQVVGVRIVQLLASLGSRIHEYHGISIVHRLAEKLGGEGYYINAPALVENSQIAGMLKGNPDIQETLRLGSRANLAVFGIGSAEPSVSPYVIGGYLAEQEMQKRYDDGAVGDVCGNFFDINGISSAQDVQEQMIGLSQKEILKIPLRIGISGGAKKVRPIIGALRGKYVNILVTDSYTAHNVMELNK